MSSGASVSLPAGIRPLAGYQAAYLSLAAQNLHQEQLLKLRDSWMQYDATAARLGYKPDTSKDSST